MATNGNFSQQDQLKPAAESYPATSGPTDTTTGGAPSTDLSKDEVGWYFVEQYYTTLSKHPEKLHVSPFACACDYPVTNYACLAFLREAISIRLWT